MVVDKIEMKEAIDEVNYYIDKSYSAFKRREKEFVLRCLQKYGSDLIGLTKKPLNSAAKELLYKAECTIDTSATTINRLKCEL